MGINGKKGLVLSKAEGFTLIELIVAVGVIGIILPTIFNIFFIIIRQQLVLVAYQTMKAQGDSAERNIKNILQNRAASITDSLYTTLDVCPPQTTPTPTLFPELYIKDREMRRIRLYELSGSIASDSAGSDGSGVKPYNLTSSDVSITNLGFTCSKTTEFNPSQVTVQFTMNKTTAFKEITLPYSFRVKLRNY